MSRTKSNCYWIEAHCENAATETPKTTRPWTYSCYKCSPRARPAILLGRNNHRLMLAILWLLHSWPILIFTSDHPNRIAHVQHFKVLKSKFVWYKKGSYDMTKVLPFARWKKEKLFERETFSDEDSDEEDSDYEEFVVTKRSKQNESVKQAKRQTRRATDQPQDVMFAFQRRQCCQRCQTSDRHKSNLWHQWIRATAPWPAPKAI